MNSLIFSQKAVYRLQQLASHVYRHSGVRHKLSQEHEMMQLLRDSVFSSDPGVRRCYEAFTMELNQHQLNALIARGIRTRVPAREMSLQLQAS